MYLCGCRGRASARRRHGASTREAIFGIVTLLAYAGGDYHALGIETNGGRTTDGSRPTALPGTTARHRYLSAVVDANEQPRRTRRCTTTTSAQMHGHGSGAGTRPRRRRRHTITTAEQVHGQNGRAGARLGRRGRYATTATAQVHDHDGGVDTRSKRPRRCTATAVT